MRSSPTIAGTVLRLNLPEFHIRDTSVFSCLVTRKTRGAFVRSETRERALRRLAAIHDEVLVALERPDASFERRDFRVELLDRLLA